MATWTHLEHCTAGTSHLQRGLPCQDHAKVKTITTPAGSEVLLIAVSDGAGSASRAEEGSQMACRYILQLIEMHLHQPAGQISSLSPSDLLLALKAHLEVHAQQVGCEATDFACTLLVAILAPQESLYFQIGDGCIVVDKENQALQVVFWPDAGLYVNETHFVTSKNPSHLQIHHDPETPKHIAMMTDGLQNLALRHQDQTAHRPFFQPLFTALQNKTQQEVDLLLPGLESFLTSEAVNARTDDDKTLVLAVRQQVCDGTL